MKNVLFISYTIPPYGGAGAQANTHFLKHLRTFGYEPIVLTVEANAWDRDPLRPGPDPVFMRELPRDILIHRTPARQPFGLWRLMKRLKLLWVYHMLVRPDERLSWSLSSIPAALWLARKYDVDLVFTNTVQAWSVAFIGLALKRALGLPWVLHSEDPWTQWPVGVWPTKLHYKLEERLERLVLRNADAINMVWATYRDEILAQHPMLGRKKITWIPCGYDEEDFAGRRTDEPERPSDRMRILHSGVFYHRWGDTGEGNHGLLKRIYRGSLGRLQYRPFELDRTVHSPLYLMEALRQLNNERPEVGKRISLEFTGKPDGTLQRTVDEMGLAGQVHQTGYLERSEFLDSLCRADVLFFPMARFADGRRMGWLPLKLYEYLATGKPVLAAAPESTASDILRRAGTGYVVPPGDVAGLKRGLVELHSAWAGHTSTCHPDWNYICRFEWQHITKRLAGLFDETIPAVRQDEKPIVNAAPSYANRA